MSRIDGELDTYIALRSWGAMTPDGRFAICFDIQGKGPIAIQLPPSVIQHLQATLAEMTAIASRPKGTA